MHVGEFRCLGVSFGVVSVPQSEQGDLPETLVLRARWGRTAFKGGPLQLVLLRTRFSSVGRWCCRPVGSREPGWGVDNRKSDLLLLR